MKTALNVRGRPVQVSNLEKPMFPKAGFTKAAVIDYYIRISSFLLPHLKNRPLTLKRYPDGVGNSHFYEKNAPTHTPTWVKQFAVPRKDRSSKIHYVLINDLPSLVWSANLADLEKHVFLARAPHIDRPTMMVFDLDPGEKTDILHAGEVALRLRELLDQFKLESFVKVSGSKGVHLHVPINTAVTYEVTQGFARGLAELMEQQLPGEVVTKMSKELRTGKVFIDWSQNEVHKTTVCVYSLRAAQERPFVAAPITWKELEQAIKKGDSDQLFFEPAEAIRRAEKMGDLFEPMLKLKQRFPKQLSKSLQELVPQLAAASKRSGSSATTRPPRAETTGAKSKRGGDRLSIAEYRSKRDFSKTQEPPPNKASKDDSDQYFVVQKHRASHLHYDFRLQMESVLRSWAVPKGVPTEAGEKHLAVRTEDHPVEYGQFEGNIPKGNYGAGSVMVWDYGQYEVRDDDPVKAFRQGKISLTLHGKKLKGEWTLVRSRSGNYGGRNSDREHWLLIKTGKSVRAMGARRENQSALTGKTMEQIAADTEKQWISNRKS